MVKTDFVICLHSCHRPFIQNGPLVGLEIFLRFVFAFLVCYFLLIPFSDSSSKDYRNHQAKHACGNNPCTSASFREMEPDDWIKFGYSLWAAHKGNRRDRILNQYQKAWSTSFDSEADLEGGGPVDFLNNPQYCCRKSVPWRPEVEARFSNPLEVAIPCPQASVAPPSSPQAGPSTGPSTHQAEDDHSVSLNELRAHLRAASYGTIYTTGFPRIEGGFFPGYLSYRGQPKTNPRLRVVFPLIPQYFISDSDADGPSCDCCDMIVDKVDVDLIAKEDPRCVHPSLNRDPCEPGKVRARFNSWVSLPLSDRPFAN